MEFKQIAVVGARQTRRPRASLKGRTVERKALEEVRALLGDAPRQRDLLIEHLHKIQDRFGHISADHIVALAREMNLALTEVFEVATFYHHFDVVKEGESVPPAVTVRVCDSLSCQLAGAEALMAHLKSILGPGVRVIHAPCIGRCEQAPAAVVGQHPVACATPEKVKALVDKHDLKHPEASGHGVFKPADFVPPERTPSDPHAVTPAYVDYDAYRRDGGYRFFAECLAGTHDPEDIIHRMEHSGLRGLGGAGFPTGRKWRIVRAEAQPKLVAVNIDEGEPGTFKDRTYLERDPHRFLEGMLIGAWVVQAGACYVYLRDEYHGCRDILEREIARLRADPPCALPPIYLRRGAGAYICGEESAMIESIEGKRGMPRLRPPYVAQIGLFGRPTLEQNMETLYWVRDVLERGAEWFASHGRNGRQGLRSFSVSGRVKRAGIHLAPAGISVQDLIDEYCGGMLEGHTFYGYLPGGASGGILPASLGNLPLDFDTLQPYGCFIGSAAIIVLSDHDRAVDAARNVMRFFKDESCGQCTPCRVGTAKALALMEQAEWDQPLLTQLAEAMMDASICGLGQAAPNPLLSVLKYFGHEVHGS